MGELERGEQERETERERERERERGTVGQWRRVNTKTVKNEECVKDERFGEAQSRTRERYRMKKRKEDQMSQGVKEVQV